MKNYKLLTFFISCLLVGSVSAQYDDLYFNPERDKVAKDRYSADRNNTQQSYSYEEDDRYYDDEEYASEDNYDYYYTSRIRRFHRPMYGMNFYDPFYTDMYYYDPFLSPFATTLIYDNFYGWNTWNRWNRWNRWNNFGWGMDPWGWNNPGLGFGLGWNSWNAGWGWNNFGWNNFGWNNFGWNAFGGGLYCPPTWGNGYFYNTINDIRNNTYYGPRTGTATRIPRASDAQIRREGPKDVTNTPRQGTTYPQDRDRTLPTPSDDVVTPRDQSTDVPNTRARAHEERRNAVQEREVQRNPDAVTPRNTTPPSTTRPRRSYDTSRDYDRNRDYQPPRTRTYEPPRQTSPDRSRSGGFDRGSSGSSSPRSSGGSSSSSPRSSSSSRRGGNN